MAKNKLRVETLTHDEASRKNAPTAELEAFVPADLKVPILAAYERRNPDLDPQLVWRGKDVADWSDLVVEAPPLYIQEKIHPKALIEDLRRASERGREPESAPDLFADFNGIEPDQRTEFYEHDQHWSNRMILGDGLKVMASFAEREGLKGQVQCIYIDPPYGIKFNSNFQWSTTNRDVKDGKADHFSREPEQVKAFRDTWADGIHSYLSYLRDRFTVARDLLADSGSIFVQIGSENPHRIRLLLDEVFGSNNFVEEIVFRKKNMTLGGRYIEGVFDYLIMYAKNVDNLKFRKLYERTDVTGDSHWNRYESQEGRTATLSRSQINGEEPYPPGAKLYQLSAMYPAGVFATGLYTFDFQGVPYTPPAGRSWKSPRIGLDRLAKANRLEPYSDRKTIRYKLYFDDYPVSPLHNVWANTAPAADKQYVVETSRKVVERCIIMATDPGDLVLDPTCGSGTTAYVAEQWGRRWITIDTSRVALALARARIMGARYPWYLLADSREGQVKEAEVTRSVPSNQPTYGRLRQGFVYKRVPHITLKSVANNSEIDAIWDKFQPEVALALRNMNDELEGTNVSYDIPAGSRAGQTIWFDLERDVGKPASGDDEAEMKEWEVPPEWPVDWPEGGREWHFKFWQARINCQREIDASIAAKADTEYLYDQPYVDPSRVRVAGPFTVESLSPHRVPAVDVDDSLFDELEAAEGRRQKEGGESADFVSMVLANLQKSGVQQAHKADRLVFSSIKGWPGRFLCAEGRVRQASEGKGDTLADSPERRAAIMVGPEYGTVARADLTAAAREAMEAGFDLLIAAAFNFDAHASEFDRMGALTVLQARINPDLHMPDLANTGAGNLFTVFGEPDIQVHEEADGMISIEVAGIDMYKGGQIEASSADDIAVWFLDTDYDYESFFVRHAYFPGANDPYKALKTTLKAEIDADAWESLKRTRSRPFPRPASGRVAVKVINHLGDEVMKVVGV